MTTRTDPTPTPVLDNRSDLDQQYLEQRGHEAFARDPLRAEWIRTHPAEWGEWQRKFNLKLTLIADPLAPDGVRWVEARAGERVGTPSAALLDTLEQTALQTADALQLGCLSPYAVARLREAVLSTYAHNKQGPFDPPVVYADWLAQRRAHQKAWREQDQQARQRADHAAARAAATRARHRKRS